MLLIPAVEPQIGLLCWWCDEDG